MFESVTRTKSNWLLSICLNPRPDQDPHHVIHFLLLLFCCCCFVVVVVVFGFLNNNNINNYNNNAFHLKAPFKTLKDTAHKNNSTTKTGDNLVQMRINE